MIKLKIPESFCDEIQHWRAEHPACHKPGRSRDLNTGLWLVHTDHVTWILTSDWSRQVTWPAYQGPWLGGQPLLQASPVLRPSCPPGDTCLLLVNTRNTRLLLVSPCSESDTSSLSATCSSVWERRYVKSPQARLLLVNNLLILVSHWSSGPRWPLLAPGSDWSPPGART